MKTIEQIVKKLEDRNESKDYIIDYLKDIINGLGELKPNHVESYLKITLHNMGH